MEVTPRYLRFARALALASLAGTAGCYAAHERPIDAGPVDAFVGPDRGPCARPLPCTCPSLSSGGTCTDPIATMCCPIVGPLAPPELSSTDSRA